RLRRRARRAPRRPRHGAGRRRCGRRRRRDRRHRQPRLRPPAGRGPAHLEEHPMSDASPSAPTGAPASTDDWIRAQRPAAVRPATGAARPAAPTAAPAATDDWIREQRHAAVLAALGQVWDPELALDVVSLGLVYDVRIGAASVDIDMTLTTPGCPVSEQLPAQ